MRFLEYSKFARNIQGKTCPCHVLLRFFKQCIFDAEWRGADSWHGFYVGLHGIPYAAETPSCSHCFGSSDFARGRQFAFYLNHFQLL